MKRWWVLLLVVGALGVGGYFAWERFAKDEGPAYRFETVVVDHGPVVARVTATGTLSALVTVQVGTQVSGRIQKLYVDFNSPVKKGQLIAQIDPALFRAAVQQGRANVASARGAIAVAEASDAVARASIAATKGAVAAADARAVDAARQHARAKKLAAEKLIAPADLDRAEAEEHATAAQRLTADGSLLQAKGALAQAKGSLLQAKGALAQAKATLHQAQINLDFTHIVSPTDGVVISRNVDVGQTVAASLQAPVLFLIAEDLSKMQVDTNVAEADVGRLRAGMPAVFTVDAHPKVRFRGGVRQIRNAPLSLQNVVTYDAVIDVENRALLLRPGMTANVTFIHAERQNVMRVPNSALRFRPPKALRATAGDAPTAAKGLPSVDGGASKRPKRDEAPSDTDVRTVWVLGGSTADHPGSLRAVKIRVGISDGSMTEVVGGPLKGDERLVIEAVPTRATKKSAGGGLKRMM